MEAKGETDDSIQTLFVSPTFDGPKSGVVTNWRDAEEKLLTNKYHVGLRTILEDAMQLRTKYTKRDVQETCLQDGHACELGLKR